FGADSCGKNWLLKRMSRLSRSQTGHHHCPHIHRTTPSRHFRRIHLTTDYQHTRRCHRCPPSRPTSATGPGRRHHIHGLLHNDPHNIHRFRLYHPDLIQCPPCLLQGLIHCPPCLLQGLIQCPHFHHQAQFQLRPHNSHSHNHSH